VVRRDVIYRRLLKLDEYLAILERFQRYSFDEFSVEPERYGSAERFLQLAIKSVIDIGNHIVADLGLGEVGWYSDIPTLLCEAEYITEEMRETWIRMIGFRNILVHDYLEVDLTIVYQVLQQGLDDFRSLRDVFARFL